MVETRDGDEGPGDLEDAIYPSPRPYEVVPGVDGDSVRTSGKYASLLFAEPFTAAIGVREEVGRSKAGGVGGGVSIAIVVSRKSGGWSSRWALGLTKRVGSLDKTPIASILTSWRWRTTRTCVGNDAKLFCDLLISLAS